MKSSHVTKILTCCYCGARSTLPPKRAHNLVCHGCGAPIRRIEALQPRIERLAKREDRKRPAIPHQADVEGLHRTKDRPERRRKGKYRKYTHDKGDRRSKRRSRGFWYYVKKIGDEAEDLIEDIFD